MISRCISVVIVSLLVTVLAVEAAPTTLVPLVVAPSLVPDAAVPGAVLDQRAIFEILCGGAAVASPRLHAHLWQVAGSLAARSWTPPRVTVRVVSHTAPR